MAGQRVFAVQQKLGFLITHGFIYWCHRQPLARNMGPDFDGAWRATKTRIGGVK